MTQKEKVIATAYTGVMFVNGDQLGEVYDFIGGCLGYGVVDIMFASKKFNEDRKIAVQPYFVDMLNGKYSKEE